MIDAMHLVFQKASDKVPHQRSLLNRKWPTDRWQNVGLKRKSIIGIWLWYKNICPEQETWHRFLNQPGVETSSNQNFWSVIVFSADVKPRLFKSNIDHKINVFEIWCYRRMLKNSWTSHKLQLGPRPSTNSEIVGVKETKWSSKFENTKKTRCLKCRDIF